MQQMGEGRRVGDGLQSDVSLPPAASDEEEE
jgi:hypothetical protein